MTAIAIARIAADNYKRHLVGRRETGSPVYSPEFFLRRAFAEFKAPATGRFRKIALAELSLILGPPAKPRHPLPLR